MLILQSVTYSHPNKDLLFSDLNFILNRHDKIAFIGNNGTGKSTLLNILAGNLYPTNGIVKAESKPYYVPQLLNVFHECTIAQALQIDTPLKALTEILNGNVTDTHLALLNDDWTLEERSREAFAHWKLDGINLTQQMNTLSGGQKTKVFLAGIMIHQPEIVLLDEPSNHLDSFSRNRLYDYIASTTHTVVVVSHDRTLLNLIEPVYELSKQGLKIYGGNYNFYLEQKVIERDAFHQDLKSKEKSVRKAKETERIALERQQKLDARGKQKQEKAGLPTISMKTFKNNAEKSTARTKGVHAAKVNALAQELYELRKTLPDADKMKLNVEHSSLHRGKVLVTIKDLTIEYNGLLLWKKAQTIQITSGERIVVKGPNGSGKTSLLKLMMGKLQPRSGTITRAGIKTLYIDQDYSLIDDALHVYEQAQQFNSSALEEHEIKTRLNRFLFTKDDWDKSCKVLSGGEKIRLALCFLTIQNQAPDIILLDEPTNNLDIQNIELLTTAMNEYKGTLIVVSHDAYFLDQLNIQRTIDLE